jgi:hypothetical protein
MPAAKSVADFLGWFSLGLGVPQVLMPRRVARSIGVRDDGKTRSWMRVVGVREHAAAAGILTTRQPAGWLGGRVAGDVMDLALLAIALRREDRGRRRPWGFGSARPEQDRRRIRMAIGAVGGVLVADALATAALARGSDDGSEGEAPQAKAAITVAGDPEQVQRTWLDRHAGDGIGMVRFLPAPGGRGTEIHVAADSSMESVKEELRRFKQLLETGEEVRS